MHSNVLIGLLLGVDLKTIRTAFELNTNSLIIGTPWVELGGKVCIY